MRGLEGARATLGVAQLVAPGSTGRVWGLAPDRHARAVVRVLGARQLAQAMFTASKPTIGVRRAGVGVDALHALSMVGLAAVDARRRRAALTDAAVASTLAVIGLRYASRQ